MPDDDDHRREAQGSVHSADGRGVVLWTAVALLLYRSHAVMVMLAPNQVPHASEQRMLAGVAA